MVAEDRAMVHAPTENESASPRQIPERGAIEAENGTRTHDHLLGKQELYQLSYFRARNEQR